MIAMWMMGAALTMNTASAASVDLAFAVQPGGPDQRWTVEVQTAQETPTRVPGLEDWELRVTMDEAAGAVSLNVGLYEVVRSASGRERYLLTTEQSFSTVDGRAVAMLYRPSDSLHWMRKQRELGSKPTALYVEATPHV